MEILQFSSNLCFTDHIKVVAAAGDKIGCEDLVRDWVW